MMNLRQLFYVFIACPIVLAGTSTVAMAQGEKIGVVGNITGVVTATDAAGTARTLDAGSPVYLNDVIVSDASSKAQIMFLDKSALMINANTNITVDRFVFDPATASGDLSIKNAKGALRFIGGALSKTKPVNIKTPVATIGIRGGIADVAVGPNNATDAVKRFGDELTMTNLGGQTKSITENNVGLTVMDGYSPPIPTPPARVNALAELYGGGANGSGFGGDDGAGEETPNQGGGDDEGNRDGGQGGPEGNEGGDGNDDGGTPAAKGNKVGDGNDGKPGANKGKGDSPAASKPTRSADGGPNGKAGPANKSAQAGAPRPAARPNGPAPVGTFTQGPAPTNLANVNVPLDGAVQVNLREEGTATFEKREFVPTDVGMYALSGTAANQPSSAGRALLASNGERLTGPLVQGYPSHTEGPRFTASLPELKQAGYQSVNDVNIDGVFTSGKAFRNNDGAMSLYNVVHNGQNLNILVGHRVGDAAQASSASKSAVGGLKFYDFLPDLARFTHGQTNFFDYSMANSNFGNTDGLGLVVDWSNGRFVTGKINWGIGANALDRAMVLSFGRTLRDGHLLDGRLYETVIDSSGVTPVPHNFDGYLRVTDGYAVENGETFSGLLLEGIQPVTVGNTTNPFDLANDGPRLFQGATLAGQHNIGTASADNIPQYGFMGGFMRTDELDSTTGNYRDSYTMYGTDSAGVTISNYADGSATAAFRLRENMQYGASDYIDASFGYYNSDENRLSDSAYLSDTLYAIQATKIEHTELVYGSSSSTTEVYKNGQVANNVLVNATHLADVTNKCSDCDFVSWGVWSGSIDTSPVGTTGQEIQTAHLIPYVAGDITNGLASKTFSPGAVNYQGPMYGSLLSNNGHTLTQHEGSFNATIDLSNRKLNSYNANFAGMNFGTTNVHSISGYGQALFSAGVTGTAGTNTVTGTINGALFGPQAENIGGNFNVGNAGLQAAGIYLGAQQ